MAVSECKQGPIHDWCNWADVSDIAKGRVKCCTCAHRWSPVIALGGPMQRTGCRWTDYWPVWGTFHPGEGFIQERQSHRWHFHPASALCPRCERRQKRHITPNKPALRLFISTLQFMNMKIFEVSTCWLCFPGLLVLAAVLLAVGQLLLAVRTELLSDTGESHFCMTLCLFFLHTTE